MFAISNMLTKSQIYKSIHTSQINLKNNKSYNSTHCTLNKKIYNIEDLSKIGLVTANKSKDKNIDIKYNSDKKDDNKNNDNFINSDHFYNSDYWVLNGKKYHIKDLAVDKFESKTFNKTKDNKKNHKIENYDELVHWDRVTRVYDAYDAANNNDYGRNWLNKP